MRSPATALGLLLLCSVSHAAPITLNDTMCNGAVCQNPAPAVEYISISETYGQVSASVGGTPLSTGAYQLDILGDEAAGVDDPQGGKDFTLSNVRLLDPNGQLRHTATLTFHHWTTRVVSGRLAGRIVNHWELKGGSLL
jgi:hypothetical protein